MELDGISKRKLQNRFWRLNNLYTITDKNAQVTPFKMNAVQKKLYWDKHYRNVVLKARQQGVTTNESIFMLDASIFNSNLNCGIIADTKFNAKEIRVKKIEYAYNSLADEIKNDIRMTSCNEDGITFSNGSNILVSTSLRSGTAQLVHVSEIGKIASKDPWKAEEIISGTAPAVPDNGSLMYESTAMGRDGFFYNMCVNGERLLKSGKKLNSKEYKFHFFAWFDNSEYSLVDPEYVIPERLVAYFNRLEKDIGIFLSHGQKIWYAVTEDEQGGTMKREYPSTPEEAFMDSLEGTYYKHEVDRVYEEDRITEVPYDKGYPVYTTWDIGRDMTSIWFIQHIDDRLNVIDYYHNQGRQLEWYADVIKDMPYEYAKHYAPHDINVREWGGGKTRLGTALEYGLAFEPVARLSVDDGIDSVRRMFKHCWFDESKTKEAFDMLASYRKEWDSNRGVYTGKPRHDKASHPSDSFRYFAVGHDWDNSGLSGINSTVFDGCEVAV